MKEHTLLEAHETKVNFEAKIIDASYAERTNYYDEYVVEFMPLTHTDEQILLEAVEDAMRKVEMRAHVGSYKEAKASIVNRQKFFYSSQLLPPKLNVSDLYPREMEMRNVSINGHLRDLPDGSIVLNIDYLDFYEESERPLTQFEKECLEDPDGGCDIDW